MLDSQRHIVVRYGCNRGGLAGACKCERVPRMGDTHRKDSASQHGAAARGSDLQVRTDAALTET